MTRKADGIRRRWCKSSRPASGRALMGHKTQNHKTEVRKMTTEKAVEILKESRRQNQVMLDNPSTFFLNDPAKQSEQIRHTQERVDALTIAINALCSQ